MIESFRHEGLDELFRTGKSRKLRPDLERRALRVLVALDHAETLRDLDAPGYATHPLEGTNRYAMRVSAQWRITFEWDEGRVRRVDLEQYH